MRKRNIDLAKGIGIMLMVVGHCYHQSNWLLQLIYAFHMPFFFIITGVLYSGKILRIKFKKQVYRLLIPYVVFELAYSIFISFMGGKGLENILITIVNNMKVTFCLIGVNVLWYLPCLLICELILLFVDKIGKCKWIILFVMLAIGLLIPMGGFWIVLWRAFVGVGFMALGYYAKQILIKQAKIYAILCVVFVFVIAGLFNDSVSLVSLQFGNPMLYIISSISGSYLLIQLCEILDKKIQMDNFACRVVEYIGKNTIIILCTHMLFIEIIRLLDYKLFNNSLYTLGILEGIVFAALAMVCEVIIIPFM